MNYWGGSRTGNTSIDFRLLLLYNFHSGALIRHCYVISGVVDAFFLLISSFANCDLMMNIQSKFYSHEAWYR